MGVEIRPIYDLDAWLAEVAPQGRPLLRRGQLGQVPGAVVLGKGYGPVRRAFGVVQVVLGDGAVRVVGDPGLVVRGEPGEVVGRGGAVLLGAGRPTSGDELGTGGLGDRLCLGVGDQGLGAGLGDRVEPVGGRGMLGGVRLELVGVLDQAFRPGEPGLLAGGLGGEVPVALSIVNGGRRGLAGALGCADPDEEPADGHLGLGRRSSGMPAAA